MIKQRCRNPGAQEDAHDLDLVLQTVFVRNGVDAFHDSKHDSIRVGRTPQHCTATCIRKLSIHKFYTIPATLLYHHLTVDQVGT